MTVFLLAVLIVLVFVVLFLFEKARKYKTLREIQNHIKWCVSTSEHHGFLDFLRCVNGQLSGTYRITEEEKELFQIILECARNEFAYKFCCDKYLFSKEEIKQTDEGFFLILLHRFLSDHSNKKDLNGIPIYVLNSRKAYKDGGALVTYNLTELGVVYYKSYYAAAQFCEKANYVRHGYADGIRECLESNNVELIY